MYLLLVACFIWLGKLCEGDSYVRGCPVAFSCDNDGHCDNSTGNCVCKPGYEGNACEIKVTPCPDQPCENGLCHTDKNGKPFCLCDHRFEGSYCELDKDECALKVCPAGASCVNYKPQQKADKGYSCICPEGYAGEFCEHEVDLCELYQRKDDSYCHNGGTCAARYICICQNGCPEKAEVCAKKFDDGHCDEICNLESCFFDGFDCATRNGTACRHPSVCAYKYGDGNCDQICSGPECGYDGGDCEGQNSTSYQNNVDMIGVAVALPPDKAIKNLQVLRAQLAQRLYSHVSLAEDSYGIMVYEWDTDAGQGNRITVVDEEIVANNINAKINGTMFFFDVDTSKCRIQRRRGDTEQHCFTDIRVAATYLTFILAKKPQDGTDAMPIRDITWRRKQLESLSTVMSPHLLMAICAMIMLLVLTLCTGIVVAIVRARRKRRKTIFAPCWKIPGHCLCSPPTPPYCCSYEDCENGFNINGISDKNCGSNGLLNTLAPIVDANSPLLLAVRSSDYEKVKEMILCEEPFADAVDENGLGALHHAVANNDAEMLRLLLNCGQLDIFEKSANGQSPLLFAARIAHPGLECVSLLVAAIDALRKARGDDVLSRHYDDIKEDSKDLVKQLPLRDEANAKYALTDAMGRNVIHYAALCNAPHLVNYFVACGANVDLIDNNGDAPIHLAAKDANLEALVALMNNNCDMNVKDSFGWWFTNEKHSDRTAYGIAEALGHDAVCKALKKWNADSCGTC